MGKEGFRMSIKVEPFERCDLQVAGTSLPVAGSWPTASRCRQEGRRELEPLPEVRLSLAGRPAFDFLGPV